MDVADMASKNQEDEKYLNDLYYNTNNETAYGGKTKLWKHIQQFNPKISRKTFDEWISKQDTITTHGPVRKNFPRKKIVTRGINDIWDADLMDMKGLEKDNDGFKYIGIFIDIFSRKLYAIPMKDKTTTATKEAFKEALRKAGDGIPNKFRSDDGKEFVGKEMKDYLADKEIYQQVARNDTKANYAERVIRTLKKKIYRFLYAKKTRRYIDELDSLVEGYNRSKHSTLGQAPSSVTKQNEKYVWAHQYIPKYRSKKRRTKIRFKFNEGDIVRINQYRYAFYRGFGQTFSEKLFKIRHRFKGIPVTYMLEEWNGTKVPGLFYEPQLVLVTGKSDDSEFRIEKILKERTRNGKKEVLIKWQGYPDSYNSWEPIENIVEGEGKNPT